MRALMQNAAYVGSNALLRYVGNDGNVRINTGTKKGTVSLWYRESWPYDGAPALNQWLWGAVGADGSSFWGVCRYGGTLRSYVGLTSLQVTLPSNYETLFPGKWYHVVLTWDLSGGVPGTRAAYWDGTKATGTIGTDVFSGVEPADINVGCLHMNATNYPGFTAVANVAIWDDVITDEQVLDLIERGWRHVPEESDAQGNLLFRATFRNGWDADVAAGTACATHQVGGITQDQHQSLARLTYHGDDTLTQRCRDIGTVAAGRDPLSWWTNVEALTQLATPLGYTQGTYQAVLTYPANWYIGVHNCGLELLGEQTGDVWVGRMKVSIEGEVDDSSNKWRFCGLDLYAHSIKRSGGTKLLDLVGNFGCHAWNTHYGGSYVCRDLQFVKNLSGHGCVVYETRPVAAGAVAAGKYQCQDRSFGPLFTPTTNNTVRIEQVEVYGEAAYCRTTRPCGNFVPVVERRAMNTKRPSRDPCEWEALHTEIVFSPPTEWVRITNPGWGTDIESFIGWVEDGAWVLLGADAHGPCLLESNDQGETWERTPLCDNQALVRALQTAHRPFGVTVAQDTHRLMPTVRPNGRMTLSDGTITLSGNARAYNTSCDSTDCCSIIRLGRNFETVKAQGPFELLACEGGVADSLRNAEGWDGAISPFLQNPYARHEGERLVAVPTQLKFVSSWDQTERRAAGFLFGAEPLTACRGARAPLPHGVREYVDYLRMSIWPPGWFATIGAEAIGVHEDELFLDVSSEGAVLHRLGTVVNAGQLSPPHNRGIGVACEFEDGEYRRVIIGTDATGAPVYVGSIRKDGWTYLGLSDGETDGYSQTCQIARPARGWHTLTVNFDPGAEGGKLEVAVLDPTTLAEIEGYGRDDCDDVTEDSTGQGVTWGQADLSGLETDENLVFRFQLSRAAAEDETPKLYMWYCTREVGDRADLENWPTGGAKPSIGSPRIAAAE